eukprot:TRINITY_DN64_c0_g3_i1.p1 TRINITY_DN64_c0_g3~~TRINITY_DN64_c0_g3_i1.p1  ORF type:complete len:192 (-),score=39.86 TRINITY_DN64_c0_g3_i1:229-804(-)
MPSSFLRFVIVGSGGVGKSAITVQFTSNRFVTEYDPTIEETYRRQVTVDDKSVMLEIMDTAGQEEYSTLREQFYVDGNGFIIVYSIVDKDTFNNVTTFKRSIERVLDDEYFPLVIVGNKCDLTNDRKVTYEHGSQLAEEFDCKFFEASAKSGTNIEEIFIELAREVYRQNKDNDTGSSSGGSGKKNKCTIL